MPRTLPPVTNWKNVREVLWKRSGGRCEVSGVPLDSDTFDAHHRRNKGMGGTSRPNVDDITNLIATDPVVHNGGPRSVHGRRRWSEDRGYLVPKGVASPGMWPVYVRGRYWAVLLANGLYLPVNGPSLSGYEETPAGVTRRGP